MRRSRVVIPMLAVALTAAAACSNDKDSAATTTITTTQEPAATTQATDAPATTGGKRAPSTTTTQPVRSVTAPASVQTGCAKRFMTMAREHSWAAEKQTAKAEWRADMAAKNTDSATWHTNQAKQGGPGTTAHRRTARTRTSAAKQHASVARLFNAAAEQEGRSAKWHQKRAWQLNSDKACREYLASIAPVPRMPLTGEVLGKGETPPKRPALVVKIDNHVQARPQSGLNEADIIFEEIVEYGTRFAAVFHSRSANPVGPIRSGRTQDLAMLARLRNPLFAWSGGNANVTNAINASHLVNLGPDVVNAYYRDRSRSVDYEHTLYSSTDTLWSYTPSGWQQPSPYFEYLRAGDEFGGDQSAGVDLQMDNYSVRWAWSPERRGYLRYTQGVPHGTNDTQISATNVAILETRYVPSPADARSPEAQTTGKGRAWIFSGGRYHNGYWERTTPTAPYKLSSGTGRPVKLTPGRTWIELAETGVDGTPVALAVP